MSEKSSGINYSRLATVRSRRSGVISRLETQLTVGSKNTKEGKVVLSDKDKTRILKELSILKTRI